MAIRIKIIFNPEDVTEMREQISESCGDNSEELRSFDEFFQEHETRISHIALGGKKSAAFDSIDLSVSLRYILDLKKEAEIKDGVEYQLRHSTYMQLQFLLEPKDPRDLPKTLF